jgi:hypothetical protein
MFSEWSSSQLVRLLKKIRAADAKEVGVGNPAEETCCYPNIPNVTSRRLFVNIFPSDGGGIGFPPGLDVWTLRGGIFQ